MNRVTFQSPSLLRNVRSSVSSPRRCSRRRRSVIVAAWVTNRAHVEIEAPKEWLYDVYADLEAMPSWSPWLDSVDVDSADSDLSTWNLAARGVSVSWRSKIVESERGRIIAWASITGLSNKGRVLFDPCDGGTRVTLEVSFMVPDWLSTMLTNDSVSSFVTKTLASDLKRFRSQVLIRQRKERMTLGNELRG